MAEAAKKGAPEVLPGRLMSLDAYRGFVMLLMASEGLAIAEVARHHPGSPLWRFLSYQVDHVAWTGCSLWDLIQPSFTFLAGVSLAFSFVSRKARGQTHGRMLRHAIVRSVILVLLGILLRSVGRPQTYFTFEDVLTQIGLGYTFVFLLCGRPPRVQAASAAVLLVGYWAAFALYPAPGPGFDWAGVGVGPDWMRPLTGFRAHWNPNSNLAAAFDQWFLNLFPREQPFVYNGGGYQTLSFIPSLATMILGLMAGQVLNGLRPPRDRGRVLLAAGVAGIVVGMLLDLTGICPVVKRIWTPSWTLYSAGWACLLMVAFYTVIDLRGYRRWAFPLVVVGMNSIAMYVLAHLERGFIADTLRTHLGQQWAERIGGVYGPIVESAAILLVLWLALLWMYRRKLFLRI